MEETTTIVGPESFVLSLEWRSIPKDERPKLVEQIAALRATKDWSQEFSKQIAFALNFRPESIRKMEPLTFVRQLSIAGPKLGNGVMIGMLIGVHLNARSGILAAFYEAVNVRHTGAHAEQEDLERPLDGAIVKKAIEEMWRRFSPGEMRVFLSLLAKTCSDAWRPAVRAACDHASRLAAEAIEVVLREGMTSGAGGEVTTDSAPDKEHAATEAPHDGSGGTPIGPSTSEPKADLKENDPGLESATFTTLDGVLIRAVVASLNETEGSLDRGQLEDLIGEVVALNDQRAKSYFHLGFHDALIGRTLATAMPGSNDVRRSWQIAGYLLGIRRGKGPIEMGKVWTELGEADCNVMFSRDGRPAAIMTAPEILDILLPSQRIRDALAFIDSTIEFAAPKLIRIVVEWARLELISGDPDVVRQVLESVVQRLEKVSKKIGPPPRELHRSLMRRLATSWRRVGRKSEAMSKVNELLRDSVDPEEKARLLTDRAILTMGIRSIEEIRIPEERGRVNFIEGIIAATSDLEEAERTAPNQPAAPAILALPVVVNSKATTIERKRAEARLRESLSSMAGTDSKFWGQTGLLSCARMYLSALELRDLEHSGHAGSAVRRLLEELTTSGDRRPELPFDLLIEAVSNAVLHEADQAADLAIQALSRKPQRLLAVLEMAPLARASAEFRRHVIQGLRQTAKSLSTAELWRAWTAVLNGAMTCDGRDVESALTALDELEVLAETRGKGELMLSLLEHESAWDPAWTHSEVDAVRIRLLLQLGRTETAGVVMGRLAHAAITDHQLDVAQDLVDSLDQLGNNEDLVAALMKRIRALEAIEATTDACSDWSAYRFSGAARIVFIGGSETQRQYEAELQAFVAQKWPRASIHFEFTGWSSNWGRQVDRMKNKLRDADAIVVMRFVRTNLGRELRRLAGELEIPWAGCHGHGRRAMERSIERAFTLVEDAAT